jgi:hypothetical protein
MNKRFHVVLLAAAVLALGACDKGKNSATNEQAAAPVVLQAPTDNSNQAWKQYLTQVVKANLHGVRSSPYLYYLPSAESEDFEAEYERQLDNVVGTVSRGVLPGNMLAFGSPETGRMAELIIEAFAEAPAGAMKDVKVLFIGQPENEEEVRASVEPSGASFIFIDVNG